MHSKSFVQNIYRGVIEPEQMFPYPEVLDEEQMETLNMLVPATSRFFEDNVDPLKFDAEEKVPDDVVKALVDAGVVSVKILAKEKPGDFRK